MADMAAKCGFSRKERRSTVTLKRLLAAVMILCLTASFCACSGDGEADTTATTTVSPTESKAPTVQSTQESTAPTDAPTKPAFDGYTVKVVDEGGNPVANAFVQLCLDNCFPNTTDDSGVATFDVEEADYKVSFVSLPEGYDYASDAREFYFEDGTKEIVITLKAVS